jgi:hypothetical protein
MLRPIVRIGVSAGLVVLMAYLCLIFISIYQENHSLSDVGMESTDWESLSDVKIETTVREIMIAGPDETADVQLVSRHDRHRWVVVFDVDRVLEGRFEKREIRFLVHSPSRDLGVHEKGQHAVFEREAGAWVRPYRFSK